MTTLASSRPLVTLPHQLPSYALLPGPMAAPYYTPPSCPSALTPASWSYPQHPQVTTNPSGPWKRRAPISDRALLRGVLHMLDALLLHIEGHLQRISNQQKTQIKECPTQTG